MSICRQIEQIISQISGRGEASKRYKGQERLSEQADLAKPVRRQQGDKNQQVFQPVLGTQCLQVIQETWLSTGDEAVKLLVTAEFALDDHVKTVQVSGHLPGNCRIVGGCENGGAS